MRARHVAVVVGAATLAAAPGFLYAQTPAGTAFTYQGQLKYNNVPINGAADFEFSLWSDLNSTDPNDQVGSTMTVSNQSVDNGLFTVVLDFGEERFKTDARWLELAVRSPHDPNDALPYSTLSPRQELTPAPYALALPGLWTQQNVTSPNVIGGWSGNYVTAGAVGAVIAGGGSALDHFGNPDNPNLATDHYGTIGGGSQNTVGGGDPNDPTDASYATVGGGTDNTAAGHIATVGGGQGNGAEGPWSVVGGGVGNRAKGWHSTIAGGRLGWATGYGATIGGGEDNLAGALDPNDPNAPEYATVAGGYENRALAAYAAIAGGQNNQISGSHASIGGGNANSATGYVATVGGGFSNVAGVRATVGGGADNAASGSKSTVAGGLYNQATAGNASVGGGESNVASGASSTVAGGSGNEASASYATIGGGGPAITPDPNDPNDPNDYVYTYNRVMYDYGTIAGGGGNQVSAWGGAVGGGQLNVAGGAHAAIAGGHNNVTDGDRTTIAGGDENRVTDGYATIGGGRHNQAGSNNGSQVDAMYATVGGGRLNLAEAPYATISGGGPTDPNDWGTRNHVIDSYGTIGGGGGNVAGWINPADPNDTIDAQYATVGGGDRNKVLCPYATIAGGSQNQVGDGTLPVFGTSATISGGLRNQVTGGGATISGGQDNEASGSAAMIPGGAYNEAAGDSSFAAGRRAKALHDGAFVWADSQNFDFESLYDNEFTVRCTGGARFWSAIDPNGVPTAGVELDAGDTAWSPMCDRNLKENFTAVDRQELLSRLANVSITTWNLKSQDPSIRHIGPVAQDFYGAFGVGHDDRHITTTDADGVALAAIQGLYEIVQEKDTALAEQRERIGAQQTQITLQQIRIAELSVRLERLEGLLAELVSPPPSERMGHPQASTPQDGGAK